MRTRAIIADISPSIRAQLEQADLEITPGSVNNILAEAETVDAQLIIISRHAAAQSFTATIPEEFVEPTNHGLSNREIEVLQLIAAGKSNIAIAQILVVSPKTVKNHVSHILHKLNLSNRVEAAVFAVKKNLA